MPPHVKAPPRPVPREPLPTPPRPPAETPIEQPRRRGCELDANTRTKITTLKEIAKWSYGDIHKEYPHIPLSTIKSTCLRARTRTNDQSMKRSGRPKILDENDRQKILKKIHETPNATYADLLLEVNNKCKKATISRLLTLEDVKKWQSMKRPNLEPEQTEKRPA